MNNHDRTFTVRTSARPRNSHRISIHKKWLKASAPLTIVFCLVALYGIYALVWLPVAAASLADENTRLRRENEIHRQQLDALANRIEAVEDTSRRIAEVSGVEETGKNEEAAERAAGGPALPLDTVETATAIDFIARRAASLEQEIHTVENILRERSRTPSWMPTVGAITDRFGVRSNPFDPTEAPEFHAGLDIAAPTGTSVIAAGTGTVTFAGTQSGYGQVVMLDHGNGYQTRYAHLSHIETTLGAEVMRGDTIGQVGSTGRSTGAHLHYEVRFNERPINPRRFLPKTGND